MLRAGATYKAIERSSWNTRGTSRGVVDVCVNRLGRKYTRIGVHHEGTYYPHECLIAELEAAVQEAATTSATADPDG